MDILGCCCFSAAVFLLLLLRPVLFLHDLPLLALLASALTSGLVLLPGVCLVQPAPLVPAVVLFFLCLLAMISLHVSLLVSFAQFLRALITPVPPMVGSRSAPCAPMLMLTLLGRSLATFLLIGSEARGSALVRSGSAFGSFSSAASAFQVPHFRPCGFCGAPLRQVLY